MKYMRLGAAYGMPPAQRILGIVTRFGLLGVPKNEIAGMGVSRQHYKHVCAAAVWSIRIKGFRLSLSGIKLSPPFVPPEAGNWVPLRSLGSRKWSCEP